MGTEGTETHSQMPRRAHSTLRLRLVLSTVVQSHQRMREQARRKEKMGETARSGEDGKQCNLAQ
jgi:hypothetical protein